MFEKQHYGDYTREMLLSMSNEELMGIIIDKQMEDNICLMMDSYKQCHAWLLPPGIQEMYEYLEARGGEMPYVVFATLQYYLKKYLCGVRVTEEKIQEAKEVSFKHFGFDCFNEAMWRHIKDAHGGRLPVKICAVPEGTVLNIRNVMMTIRNTDHKNCAALVGPLETLIMKIWAGCTVASYNLAIMQDIRKGWRRTSTIPESALYYLHHDFGYRGVSSEESARILAAAALFIFQGTDTMGALKFLRQWYHADMAGYSVFATEHSVHCAYGGSDDDEIESFRHILTSVFGKFPDLSILSMVMDTNNVWRTARQTLPSLKETWIGKTNRQGVPLKIVGRPDSGVPSDILFGFKSPEKLREQLQICEQRNHPTTAHDLRIGIHGIFSEEFGSSINDKGYKTLMHQIGILQGDGVSRAEINKLYDIMYEQNIATTDLVFGSGGKNLQAHDRDEMKFAIKATHIVDANGRPYPIKKNPVTDAGKASKSGFLKLTYGGGIHSTISSNDEGFDEAEDLLVPVFENGELLVDYTLDECRARVQEFLQTDLLIEA